MKKILALTMAAIMLLAFASCGAKVEPKDEPATESQMVGGSSVANPITEYNSLEELNRVCNSKLTHPGVPGVTDESFSTVSCDNYTIAQYRFSINGYKCTLRFASDTTEDISGVYVSEGTAFSGVAEGTVKTETGYVARWFTIDGQYVFMVDNNDDEEWFGNALDEIRELHAYGDTNNTRAALYAEMAGSYQDSVSQRASATITDNGGQNITIVVDWSSSAAESTEWTMTATKTEDGLITYKDCKCVDTVYSENGEASESVAYENGEGYFSYEDGKLLWTGAADESCRGCIFEKIPEA